jgi:A/G-specific adenine glycosylase
MTKNAFLELLDSFYKDNSRSMPWRDSAHDGSFDPYKILVSEIMLQQTQVDRVIPKFKNFIARFPTMDSLAEASFAEVLALWSGLGYNRRAQYLHEAAKVLHRNGPEFPRNIPDLITLKGIGANTAAAVLVYSFNQREYFVETNIRTVFIYHFFTNKKAVPDSDILAKLIEIVPADNPRKFYWALMDYGTYLKKQGIRNNAQSRQYKKQTSFEGSSRQLRGEIIRQAQFGTTIDKLHKKIDDKRLNGLLQKMSEEKLISVHNGRLSIA